MMFDTASCRNLSHRYDEDDDDRLYLVIKSEDRLFSISYMLGQKDAARPFSPVNPYIIVKGKEFKGGAWSGQAMGALSGAVLGGSGGYTWACRCHY